MKGYDDMESDYRQLLLQDVFLTSQTLPEP